MQNLEWGDTKRLRVDGYDPQSETLSIQSLGRGAVNTDDPVWWFRGLHCSLDFHFYLYLPSIFFPGPQPSNLPPPPAAKLAHGPKR